MATLNELAREDLGLRMAIDVAYKSFGEHEKEKCVFLSTEVEYQCLDGERCSSCKDKGQA